MIKSKKQMYTVIGAFIIVMLLTTVTYAFFNYTRTGVANNIRTGRISFNFSQSDTIHLTNVFPIASSEATGENDNYDEVIISITGDTTYTTGVEYLVTAEDVNIKIGNKKIPVGLIITPEKTGDLGESNDDYFLVGERGGNTSYYKVIAGENEYLANGQYLIVGYIAPGATGVNGTIGISAFIDKTNIAISDTYDGKESDNMGTTNSWVNGRVVLTTDEWNSLQGNNAISFKVRVQANEGIWVGEPLSRNDMVNLNDDGVLTNDQKSSIDEIHFIRMSEEMINTHRDAIDLKDENGEGIVKGWIDGTKLYIASPGETYFPEDSSYLFAEGTDRFSSLNEIVFGNINTSDVTTMEGIFQNSDLTYIDLSGFDTSNLTNMNWMFQSSHNLVEINLSGFDTSNVTSMLYLFDNCTSIEKIDMHGLGSDNLDGNDIISMFGGCYLVREIDMSGFNFGSAKMDSLFSNLTHLEDINIKNIDTSNVASMNAMFYNCSSLTKVDLSHQGSTSLTTMSNMFYGCTNLEELDMSYFNFGNATLTSFYNYGSNYHLRKVDLNHADASNVSSMDYMFYGNSNLETVDLSYFKTGSNMNLMFSRCSSLVNINLSNIDTSEATTMQGLFSYCSSLTSIDLSHIDTSNVTDISYMFENNNNLQSVNLSNLGNGNINVYGMFNNCTNLKEINMSGFTFGDAIHYLFSNLTNLEIINLSNVNTSNVKYMQSLFKNCTKLTTIDLSSFNTSQATNMSEMFAMETYDSSTQTMVPINNKLTTIKVGNNWSTNSVTNSTGMFHGCTNLVGGSGTVYDSNYIDKTYAKVDGGTSNPGYLTLAN